MKLIIFILASLFLISIGCKNEESTIVETELLYNDLIGVWDVEFESRYFENENLRPERNRDGNLILTISEGHKLLMQDNMSGIISDDICKEIFITESLDQVIALGVDTGLTVGTAEDRIVTFYDVLSREEGYQVWETTRTLVDFDGNDIRSIQTLTMTKR